MINAIRSLFKFSRYSVAMTMPAEILQAAGWKVGDKIDVHYDEEGLGVVILKRRERESDVTG